MSLTKRINRSLRQFGFEIFHAEPASLGYGTAGGATLRNRILRALARAGYGVRRTYGADVSPHLVEIAERVRPYTMTSPQSAIGLCEAVEYIARTGVPGALVECGVWRGGSVMAMALTLQHCGADDRELYLFDTFAGMTRPDQRDRPVGDLVSPLARWERAQRGDGHNEWAYAPLQEVRANVLSTGYPAELVRFVKGPVEQTVPEHAPSSIALLRLDTDWHASTRHELEHLYPRLESRGVLILDDYGSWAGARQAVDEYDPIGDLALIRLDNFCRIAVRP